MTGRPVSSCIKRDQPLVAKAHDSVRSATLSMAEHCCSCILICEGEQLRGIFTERDLLVRVVAEGLDPDRTTLGQVMSPEPDTIESGEPVIEAIRRMDEFHYRHLPVIESGKVLGVVALRDLPFDDLIGMQPELDQRHALAERMW
ncbi:MAG: CBS domain-containing protein [Geminicoccaceae bacterium]